MAKSSKKMRKSRGRSRYSRRCWSGGAAPLTDTSMVGSSKMNLAQGTDYASIHKGQHGGMAPVGYTGMLDDSLRATARIGVLDESMQAIQGMSDQSGGFHKGFTRRLKRGVKRGVTKVKGMFKKLKSKLVGPKSYSRKFMNLFRKKRGGARRSRKMAALLKNMRRKMRGGSAATLAGAQDYSAPGMLLSPADEARALGGMNPEWKLATDPTAFAPKM